MSNHELKRAGLLWQMIKGQPGPRSLLTSKERNALSDHYEEYRNLGADEKRTISRSLQSYLSSSRPTWPAVVGIVGIILWTALLLYDGSQYPALGILRLHLFYMLLLANLSFFAIYFLDNLEIRLYFRLDLRPSSLLSSILAFTALTMLLATINLGLPYAPRKLDPFHYSLLLVGVGIAPLFEEIAFRQWLPSRIGRDPHWLGHLIASAIFTAAHIPDSPEMALYYFLCALTLALLRIQTDSLLWTFLVHASANVAIVIASP